MNHHRQSERGVVPVVFMLLGMWVSFMVGAATHEIVRPKVEAPAGYVCFPDPGAVSLMGTQSELQEARR